jgi:FHS family L-fucose permease-like MFS transporter
MAVPPRAVHSIGDRPIGDNPIGGGATIGGAPSYRPALILLASLFFMWGFATVLNDILVPHLKAVFQLNYAQSLMIQFIFYLAYFLMSLPWAKLMERIGYKRSMVTGLVIMASGALAFIPSARFGSFNLFLLALFVLASGITLLQVAANPYVAVIGPAESAPARLNLVQAFNSMGTMFAPLFGGMLILGRSTSGTGSDAADLSDAQRLADAQAVQLPYLLIAGVLFLIAIAVWRFKLPDLGAESRRAAQAERKHLSLWRHRNLLFGVPAIFIYLIAEIGIGSTLVNYVALPKIGNMSLADAANYLVPFWGGAMAGRFIGAGLMRRFSPHTMLAAVSVAAFLLIMVSILSSGGIAMWALIAVGLCHSIMFPTIFTLGIRGLGPLTEEGSGLLIMAIAGGALSDFQGVLADHFGLQLSYLLPAVCYLYVLFYAVWGSKVVTGAGEPAIDQQLV